MSLKGKAVTLVHGNELSHLPIKLLKSLSTDFQPKTFFRLWMSWIHVNGLIHTIDVSLPVYS